LRGLQVLLEKFEKLLLLGSIVQWGSKKVALTGESLEMTSLKCIFR